MKHRKIFSLLSSLVGLALFVIAVIALRHELHGHTWAEVSRALRMIPVGRLLLATLFVVLIYTVMTGYDTLAFSFIRHKIAYRSIAYTSFIGHALANNIGFAAILNSSVRLRYYLARGVTAIQVLQVIAFSSLTFWLGFSTVATTIFLVAPPPIPDFLHLPFTSAQPVGFFFLALLVFYLLWSTTHQHQELRIHGQVFRYPPLPISILQIAVSGTEWILGASIVYILLPHGLHLSFVHFLSIFLLAQISGLISQIPGGIGVFESIILALIPGARDVPEVLASLFVYRILFNLLPLLLATVLLGAKELIHRRNRARNQAAA